MVYHGNMDQISVSKIIYNALKNIINTLREWELRSFKYYLTFAGCEIESPWQCVFYIDLFVCVFLRVSAMWFQIPTRPEEQAGSPGAGVTGGCEQWGSRRILWVLNCCAISPAPGSLLFTLSSHWENGNTVNTFSK